MRAEDPRPEPEIEWPGLAADIDGRRDIANAILADQSGADHGEVAQGASATFAKSTLATSPFGNTTVLREAGW